MPIGASEYIPELGETGDGMGGGSRGGVAVDSLALAGPAPEVRSATILDFESSRQAEPMSFGRYRIWCAHEGRSDQG